MVGVFLFKKIKNMKENKWIIKTRIHDIEWSGEDWDDLPEEVSIDFPVIKGKSHDIKRIHKTIRRLIGDFYQRKIINSSLDFGYRDN